MKLIITFSLFIFTNTLVLADTHVKGYTRKDGTYVEGYTRSNADAYRYNNQNSVSNGGSRRDEYSKHGATNKTNSTYGNYDNDIDGVSNPYDSQPESKKGF
jgi:hypothetical protein